MSFEKVLCEAPSAMSVNLTTSSSSTDAGGSPMRSGLGVNVAVSNDGGITYSAPQRLAYSTLTLSSLFPPAGPTGGDTSVTIRGSAMKGVTRCRFGGLRTLGNTILALPP